MSCSLHAWSSIVCHTQRTALVEHKCTHTFVKCLFAILMYIAENILQIVTASFLNLNETFKKFKVQDFVRLRKCLVIDMDRKLETQTLQR